MFRETQEYGGQGSREGHSRAAPAGETARPSPSTIKALPSLPPHTGDEPGPDATARTNPMEHSHPATPSASADAGGQGRDAIHPAIAACEDISGHVESVSHSGRAGSGEGQMEVANQTSDADPALIDTIREQWRRRQAWVRAQTSLTLTAKAQCRRLCGGDKDEAQKLFKAATTGKAHHELAPVAAGAIGPLFEAQSVLEGHRKAVEKELAKLAKDLPAADFIEQARGISIGAYAGIVGEAGDIGSYKSVSALWKRMGLAVINGGRQRRVAGIEALDHGYAPERRAVMWNIGEGFVKQGDRYRRVYLERILKEVEKARDEGLIVATTVKKTVESWEARKLGTPKLVKEIDPDIHRSAGHIHNRAKRYAEKRFLRELYGAWRRGGQGVQGTHAPVAAPQDTA